MADTVILANCRYGRKNANFTPESALWENPRTDLSRKPRLFAGYHETRGSPYCLSVHFTVYYFTDRGRESQAIFHKNIKIWAVQFSRCF